MIHVLITGAGGHLGRKLFDHLEAQAGFTVSGLDIRPVDHPAIFTADLAAEPNWSEHLEGVDVIVHLAGDPNPRASWPSCIRNNMDATLALYHHAVEKGVKRVVFASSTWLHGDKRFTTAPLTTETPPGPVNAYGMSKLFGERTGAYFSQYYGLSVVCLRIGWTQWTHDNQPGPHMALGRWGQEMWLSDQDYLGGMVAAITAEDVPFAALNLMSENPRMRWDISATKATIGYRPEDGRRAIVPASIRLKSWLKKQIYRYLQLFADRWFDW